MKALDLQAFWIRDALVKDREAGLEHIAEVLRSDKPLSIETRALLANILDPNGTGDWKAKLSKRGGKGPIAGGKAQRMRAIGEYLEEAVDERKEPYENAMSDAMKAFKVSRTTAVEALTRRREEREIMDEIEHETGERPMAVFKS